MNSYWNTFTNSRAQSLRLRGGARVPAVWVVESDFTVAVNTVAMKLDSITHGPGGSDG